MTQALDLSVVFPVFNEEENVPILLDEIARALNSERWTYEIIAVDDGSRDGSLDVLREARKRYQNLRVITFEKNSGQTAALDAGWRAARGDFVVSLDADLQNDPADTPRMMRKREELGVDMIIGVRVNRHDTWSRRMQSKIGNGDTGCSLKLVRREAVDRVRLYTGMHRFLPTLVRMAGYRVAEMPVNHRARRFGVSKYGAMNRAARGLVDCMAVRWMGKRMLSYKIAAIEPEVYPSRSEGSSEPPR